MTLDYVAGRMDLDCFCENGDFHWREVFQGAEAALRRGEDVNRIWQRGDFKSPTCADRPDCDFKAVPLQAAIQRNHVGIVGLLLEQPGIDVNLQTFFGCTPLHMACMSGRTKIVRMLLSFPGIDPHIPNDMGRIPLIEAYHHRQEDCLIEMVHVATKDELVVLMKIVDYSWGLGLGLDCRWIKKYLLNYNSKYTEEEKALQQEKEMTRHEEEKKRKEEEKKKIGQGKGRNARKRKKREEEERRKREEEEALLQNTDNTLGDQNKIHYEENDQSKEEVKGAMIREPMNKGLVEFIDRQILDLEEELECPVCLEVANHSPIFKCPDDHLICRWVVSM